MKIALLNTSENSGGAAVACNRLMIALKKQGLEVKLIVLHKTTDSADVLTVNSSYVKRKLNFLRFAWERFVLFTNNKFSKKNLFEVSLANTGVDVSKLPAIKEADIIHIHWINQGFLSLKDIQKLINTGKPIVITMHDMWFFTGICHYSWGCTNFHSQCGNCKFLIRHGANDYSHKIWLQKHRVFKNAQIQLVAVSKWLAEQTQNSSLFHHHNVKVIPNVIDVDLFKPMDKALVREQHKLPIDKKIVLFAAAKIDDPIKGFQQFCDAVNVANAKANNTIFVVILGQIKGDETILSQLSCGYKYFSLIKDKALIAQLFAASDVVVNSSYYETFGQTLIEAMACGSVPISFDNGGAKDIIDHKVNGYWVPERISDEMAKGIYWILFEADYKLLSNNARQKVITNYSEEIVAQQYIELYKNATKKHSI